MKLILTCLRALITVVPLALTLGCDEKPDERINQANRELAARQAEQQKQFVQIQKELTEGSRKLVESDAKARAELVAVQQGLRSDQAEFGRQRDALEIERKEIARTRYLDPIIAAAIEHVGIILACLLPLGLGFYLLFTLNRHSQGDEVLTEFLIQEVANDLPMLSQSKPRALPSVPLPIAPS
ncbi:MAG: hypothetical protein ACLQNE_03710 [Thermoguttaceae bacterium]